MMSESFCESNGNNIIQVTIHYCDNLKSKILLLQPVLCMHVIDANTGTYAKKSDRYDYTYLLCSYFFRTYQKEIEITDWHAHF